MVWEEKFVLLPQKLFINKFFIETFACPKRQCLRKLPVQKTGWTGLGQVTASKCVGLTVRPTKQSVV